MLIGWVLKVGKAVGNADGAGVGVGLGLGLAKLHPVSNKNDRKRAILDDVILILYWQVAQLYHVITGYERLITRKPMKRARKNGLLDRTTQKNYRRLIYGTNRYYNAGVGLEFGKVGRDNVGRLTVR